MAKFCKTATAFLLAAISLLPCACGSAEQTDFKDQHIYGVLLFAQPIEKSREAYFAEGRKPPVYFEDLNSMVLALRAKKVDALLDLPQPVSEYICNRNQDMQMVEAFDEAFQGNLACRMGIAKNNTRIYELMNSAIQELNANGTLAALQQQYVNSYVEKGKEPPAVTIPHFDGAKTIRVAVTGDMPPIDLMTVDGTPAGFNVALMAEIAKLKKINIVPVPMNSGSRFISLNNEVVDVVFYTDKAIYNDAKKTELWEGIHVPDITTTDIYAKYPIRYIVHK